MEFMPRLLSRDESDAMALRLRTHIEQHGWGLWAVEIAARPSGDAANEMAGDRTAVPPLGSAPAVGSFIGFVGLSVPTFDAHFTPCVEIGWRLARESWGQGFASEAALATLHYAFSELGFQEIVSFTSHVNTRSRRVMEKIGMLRDAAGDFEHPRLTPGHPLRLHVLYRAKHGPRADL